MRIGIFGGSFDPVHLGHVEVSKAVFSGCNLDKLIFLPSNKAPHKIDKSVTDGKHRVKMLQLAIKGIEGFEVSDIDLKRDKISYTVDSLRELRKQYPKDELYFMIGEDMVFDVENWRDTENLFKLCSFIGMRRPNSKLCKAKTKKSDYIVDRPIEQQIEYLKNEKGANIILQQVPQIDISSTEIRKLAGAGKNVEHLVGHAVSKYILKNSLYLDKYIQDRLNQLELKFPDLSVHIARVKNQLKEKRYNHTLGVVITAFDLASQYCKNEECIYKAVIAAVYHDYAKKYTLDETAEIFSQMGVDFDASKFENTNLTHGRLAAAIVKKEFGINDKEIISAISNHTTGKLDMTIVDKCVYLADYCEHYRDKKYVGDVQKIMYDGLDNAVIETMKSKISHLKKKGIFVDNSAYENIKFLERNNFC